MAGARAVRPAGADERGAYSLVSGSAEAANLSSASTAEDGIDQAPASSLETDEEDEALLGHGAPLSHTAVGYIWSMCKAVLLVANVVLLLLCTLALLNTTTVHTLARQECASVGPEINASSAVVAAAPVPAAPLSPPPSDSRLSCNYSVLLFWNVAYLTDAEYRQYTVHVGKPPPPFAVVGMTGGVVGRGRMGNILETWAKPISDRVVFFSDVDMPELRAITLPSLFNRSTYGDAQHRQFRGLRWLHGIADKLDADLGASVQDATSVALRSDVMAGRVDWILLVDDDTFINVRVLETFLLDHQQYANRPILYCFVFDRPNNSDRTYCPGGAGMLLSRPAALQLASHIYGRCRFYSYNDDTLGWCMNTLEIPTVHSMLFQNNMEAMQLQGWNMPANMNSVVCWHRADNDTSRRMQASMERRHRTLQKLCT